jgi:hypothetical protein
MKAGVLVAAGLALLGASATVAAQTVVVSWEFERALKAEAFLLTAEGTGPPLTWQTPPSAPGVCPGSVDGDTYCTRLPQCPPLGSTKLRVAAVLQGETTPSVEAPLACQVTSQVPCRLTCPHPSPPQRGPLPGVGQLPAADTPTWTPTQDGRQVWLDLPSLPTQETSALPPIERAPSLPRFQPAQSQAPI